MKYYQQGDVLLKKLDKLPAGLTALKGTVLQQSEITGHHHHFAPEAPVQLYQSVSDTAVLEGLTTITPNEGKYLEVKEDGTLLFHGTGFQFNPTANGTGDHCAIALPAGYYEVDIVREYDYDAHEVKRVVD